METHFYVNPSFKIGSTDFMIFFYFSVGATDPVIEQTNTSKSTLLLTIKINHINDITTSLYFNISAVFPSPLLDVTNSTMSGCINVSINQQYSATGVSYSIILNCPSISNSPNIIVANETIIGLTEHHEICSENIDNELEGGEEYCSGSDYTVTVELTRSVLQPINVFVN